MIRLNSLQFPLTGIQQQTFLFCQLPPETFSLFLKFLPTNEIVATKLVSKHFYECLHNNAVWLPLFVSHFPGKIFLSDSCQLSYRNEYIFAQIPNNFLTRKTELGLKRLCGFLESHTEESYRALFSSLCSPIKNALDAIELRISALNGPNGDDGLIRQAGQAVNVAETQFIAARQAFIDAFQAHTGEEGSFSNARLFGLNVASCPQIVIDAQSEFNATYEEFLAKCQVRNALLAEIKKFITWTNFAITGGKRFKLQNKLTIVANTARTGLMQHAVDALGTAEAEYEAARLAFINTYQAHYGTSLPDSNGDVILRMDFANAPQNVLDAHSAFKKTNAEVFLPRVHTVSELRTHPLIFE